ncbi:MAG: DUF4340 domain-containing protein [Kiloniellaceae bacterium]
MKRTPIILAAILVLQVAGAVALGVMGPDYGAYEANEPLVAFDADRVDEVAIDASEGESVVLRRQEDGWILPGLHDFPADTEKVADLLKRLQDLKKGLPVAVTGAAVTRFKVTEESHERRIALRAGGDALGEVLFGTSPSFRQVHVRTPDDDAVYSVSFATYEAGTRPEDWMDRDFLEIPEDEIARIELSSVALVRGADGLAVDGLAEGEVTVEEEANKLLRTVARPTFTAVEGRGDAALERVDEPDFTVTVKRKDGASTTYRYKKVADKNEYVFASSAHDYLFRVVKYAVEPILEATREKLVKPAPAGPGDGDAKIGEGASASDGGS